MEIEIGNYIRTNNGVIGKLIRIERDNIDIYLKWYVFYDGKKEEYINKPYITNYSFNIIDLVEVGDYVNGYKVISIDYDVIDNKTECIELDLNNNYQYNFISARQIKSIVTHEQMASIEYKVEEEK